MCADHEVCESLLECRDLLLIANIDSVELSRIPIPEDVTRPPETHLKKKQRICCLAKWLFPLHYFVSENKDREKGYQVVTCICGLSVSER